MEERDDTGIKPVFCRGSSNYMGFMQGNVGGDANVLSVLIFSQACVMVFS